MGLSPKMRNRHINNTHTKFNKTENEMKKSKRNGAKIANSQSKQNESQSNQSEPVKVKINLSIRTIELGTKGLQTHSCTYIQTCVSAPSSASLSI